MLDRFPSFHLLVSVIGKSSSLTRVWCYSAQARDSAAPSASGQDVINRRPRVNPGLCSQGPSGRRQGAKLLPELVS
jgi:hypothetical protein